MWLSISQILHMLAKKNELSVFPLLKSANFEIKMAFNGESLNFTQC